jgi:pyruvate-formate lyase-activating enzyme
MTLEKRDLYRLPWSMNDNPIAWLEVTDLCNIHCEGCYRQHLTGHKTLDAIKDEIAVFKRWRNPDNVSIAGGEPLVHPQIMDIVAHIHQEGLKPVVLTNAQALTPTVVRELKKAGCAGFTIHIDSHQNRPGWQGKTEADLNALRQQCADMIAAEGGMYVIFNSTVYPSTYHEIPDVLRWGQANVGRVHGLVFITYRTMTTDDTVAFSATKQTVDATRLGYARDRFDESFITGPQVYQILKDALPEYDPSGYLGGSLLHTSYKWLIGALVGSRHGVFGSVGKQTMEVAQTGHHLLYGRYLAYLAEARIGAKIFLLSPWDKTLRRAAAAWWRDIVRHPSHLFAGVYTQSIGIIQAPDLLPDGRVDMCDSCPDITVYDGNLINSCRMDEYRLFGGFLQVAQRTDVEAEKSKAN